MKNNIFNIFLICIFLLTSVSLSDIKLIKIAIVNDKIITNVDLIKEMELIKILNNLDTSYNDTTLKNFALNNLINEIVKEEELKKNDIQIDKNFADEHYKKLIYELKNKNFNISKQIDEKIYKKILLDYKWNTLISDKFRWKINININEIDEKLKNSNNDENKIISLRNELINKEKNKKLEIYSLNYLATLKKNSLIKFF